MWSAPSAQVHFYCEDRCWVEGQMTVTLDCANTAYPTNVKWFGPLTFASLQQVNVLCGEYLALMVLSPSSLGWGLHKPRYLCVEGRVSEISLPEYDNSGLPSREKSACNTYQVNTKILFPNQNNIWIIKLNALPHINHGIISICYMAGILLPMRDKPEHSRFSSKTTEMFIPDHMVSRLVSGGISEHPC